MINNRNAPGRLLFSVNCSAYVIEVYKYRTWDGIEFFNMFKFDGQGVDAEWRNIPSLNRITSILVSQGPLFSNT